MADKKAALLGLMKQIDGTLSAAGLKVVAEKGEGGKNAEYVITDGGYDMLRFSGDAGDVRLAYQNNTLEVLATKEEGGEFQSLASLLFEAESDDWSAKDIRSAANEVSETISDFFGTTFVTAGSTEKAQKAKAEKAAAEKAAAPAPKKKKVKKSVDSFEPIDLFNRLEAIYPDYAGKVDENEAHYGTFLPEEYLQQNPGLLKDILQDIRTESKDNVKRLFKTFNTYYDDGEKDTQSLIAVSILGIAASEEEGLLPIMEKYLTEDIYKVVQSITAYLNTGTGRRKMKAYNDPKPYKPSLKERWGKQGLNPDAGRDMLDGSNL